MPLLVLSWTFTYTYIHFWQPYSEASVGSLDLYQSFAQATMTQTVDLWRLGHEGKPFIKAETLRTYLSLAVSRTYTQVYVW